MLRAPLFTAGGCTQANVGPCATASSRDPHFLSPGRSVDSQPKLGDSQHPACGVAAEVERDVDYWGAQTAADTEEEGGVMLLQ